MRISDWSSGVCSSDRFKIGERFGFDWLRRSAGSLPTDTAWDKLAVSAIVDDFYGHQSELTIRVLNGSAPVTGGAKSKAKAKGEGAAAGTGGTETVIATWSAGREPLVARTEQLLEELKASGTPHFSMLAVATRQLKSMISG